MEFEINTEVKLQLSCTRLVDNNLELTLYFFGGYPGDYLMDTYSMGPDEFRIYIVDRDGTEKGDVVFKEKGIFEDKWVWESVDKESYYFLFLPTNFCTSPLSKFEYKRNF